MAIFDLSNAAGHGFNMSTTNGSGWAYVEADANITTQMTFDDGSTALFDVYGSTFADQFGVNYSVVGDQWTIYDLAYTKNAEVILTVNDLYLHTTTSDLQAGAWLVRVNAENDEFYGNDYRDIIHAGYGNDLVVGFAGNDTLFGDNGQDKLSGGLGNDTLIGGAGNDVLHGGTGNDTLAGGTGNDYFVFSTAPNSTSNVDRITDFNVEQDTIRLENAVMPGLGSHVGTLASTAFWKNTSGHAHDANDHVIYETDTGWLNYDSNGSRAGGEVHIAHLSAHLNLTASDFLVI